MGAVMIDEQNQQNIRSLEKSIETEIDTLKGKMFVKANNTTVKIAKLRSFFAYLLWVNKNWEIRQTPIPKVVAQKEIFYCELGENIGSEQNGKRPVVILQNNIGNTMGNTSIIVPITTYDNSVFYDKDSVQYIKYIQKGKQIDRKLDFYEIKIDIIDTSAYPIHGVANVVHMREISQKRLSSTPVATITNTTYQRIVSAVIKNISEF